jgi:hypothetical protein
LSALRHRSRRRSRLPCPIRLLPAVSGHKRPRRQHSTSSNDRLRPPSSINGQATDLAPDRKAGGSIPSRRTIVEYKFGPPSAISACSHKRIGTGWFRSRSSVGPVCRRCLELIEAVADGAPTGESSITA